MRLLWSKISSRVVLPTVPACYAGKTDWRARSDRALTFARPGARFFPLRTAGLRAQRPRPESSRSQAETACWLLSASRRRAARAWLAEIVFASGARPGVLLKREEAVGRGAGAVAPGSRCASYARAILVPNATQAMRVCLLQTGARTRARWPKRPSRKGERWRIPGRTAATRACRSA